MQSQFIDLQPVPAIFFAAPVVGDSNMTDEKSPQAFMRPAAAAVYLGCGRTSLHILHETDPTFPKKIRLTPRCVGWRRVDLDRWLEQKAKQAGGVVA